MNLLFKMMLAALLIFLTTSANALIIEISESADFSGLVITEEDTDGNGVVTLSSGLGGWIVNVVTGLSSPLIGDEYVDEIHLNSVNVSGGSGTIYIRLSDNGFDRGDASYRTAFGGVTDGTVSFQSYIDSTNALFGQGLLLSDSGDITAGAFSGQDSGGIGMSGLYSVSIYAAVTHDGGVNSSSFDYIVKVPEPSTIALFGIGLFGIAITRRRRALLGR